jgi:hypothetical protein
VDLRAKLPHRLKTGHFLLSEQPSRKSQADTDPVEAEVAFGTWSLRTTAQNMRSFNLAYFFLMKG